MTESEANGQQTGAKSVQNKELKTDVMLSNLHLKADASYKTWCPEVTNQQDIESLGQCVDYRFF